MAKPNSSEKKVTGYKMIVGALGLLIGSFIMHNQYIYLEKYDVLIMADTALQWIALAYFVIGFGMMSISRISRIKHNKTKNTASTEANVTGPKDAQLSTAPRKYKVLHTHDARQK